MEQQKYIINLADNYHQELTRGKITKEELIKKFLWVLIREGI